MAKNVRQSDRATDDAIAQKIERALGRLGFPAVECEVSAGTARLAGRVTNESDVVLVVATALTTPGVIDVKHELSIDPDPSSG